MAPDSSGRILVAGNSDRDPTAGLNDDMVIWRYSSGGTLDTTFNSQGWVVHDGAAGGAGPDIGVSIALDTSGRILVAGNSDSDPTAGFSDDMVIWRYTFAGTLDTTFNGQGWVVHDSAAGGAGPDVGVGIAQDASGRIFVAGYSDRDPSTEITMDMVIWQYTSGGTLDTAFNGQGWVVHDNAAGGGGFDIGVGIVLDASGRILVAGYSDSDPTGVPGYDMAIWRYTSAGTVDATFNGQGWVVHDSAAAGGGDDFGLALAQDAYGRILVAGYSDSDPTVGTDFDMVIWRFK
ncbi:MAG: hypothetical protein O7H41_11970 [Planctomycetota bacterium]|nr:hypothetical protein [Planctomycetota bacterium]